tara:strand:+ start:852 stop:1157 length:306 start_codon:yes stop_codon:yes gene_type:complete
MTTKNDKTLKPICEYCGKTMPKIGRDRVQKNCELELYGERGYIWNKNDNYNKDWEGRKYHKKCWKLMKKNTMYMDIMNRELGSNVLSQAMKNLEINKSKEE